MAVEVVRPESVSAAGTVPKVQRNRILVSIGAIYFVGLLFVAFMPGAVRVAALVPGRSHLPLHWYTLLTYVMRHSATEGVNMRAMTTALVSALLIVLGGCGSGVPEEGRAWRGAVDTLASGVVVVDNPSVGLRTLGTQGAGPGEFGNAFGIKVSPNGSLWVMHPGNGRYTVFDTAGNLVATHQRPIGFFRMDGPAGFDRDGFLYDNGMRHAADARQSTEVLVRINETAEVVDTVPLPEYSPEAITIARANGTPYMNFPKPFSPRLVWRFDPRGYIWSAVGDRYELVQSDLDGDTLRIVRQEYTPVPVSAEVRDSALDVIQDRIASVGAGARVEGEREVAEV